MPDLTANEQFFDALVRHQIGLLRLSGGISRDVHKLLDATEADMADKIKRVLRSNKGLDTPASVNRMNRLLKSLKATRLRAWSQVDAVWVKELSELAAAEPAFVGGMLKTTMPATLDLVLPATNLLKSLVKTKPFEGKTLKEWSRHVARADVDRISDQIKIGMVQGESSQAIARRVVGTVRQRGRNGVTEITRRQAAGLSRTAVNAFAYMAKSEFYEANEDLIKKEVWVSTLDGRTTPICRSLDGQEFPRNEGPRPPQHWMCRSTRVAIVTDKVIGDRPTRAFTEQQLVREFSEAQGIPTTSSRGSLPRGKKGAFDTFARKRKRELTGRTPAKVSYQEWLGRQSKTFQEDVLGVTKAKLFREGELKLTRFVDRAGKELTLSQLARSARDAFVKAGLDPEDFL